MYTGTVWSNVGDRTFRPFPPQILRQGQEKGLTAHAKQLSCQYSKFLGLGDVEYTAGIILDDLIVVEEVFGIRVFVYELRKRSDRLEDSSPSTVPT